MECAGRKDVDTGSVGKLTALFQSLLFYSKGEFFLKGFTCLL